MAESDFKDLVVQAVSRDFCFQKGVILQREVIPEGAERKKLMKK